jgi:hypothetical protein
MVRHQHVSMYLELIVICRCVETVVEILVILIFEEDLLPIASLLKDMLRLIYY